MHPAFEVEAKLRDYLDQKLGLQDLREWFHRSGGALMALPVGTRASELATALQLMLIEYGHGDFSERQVKLYIRKTLGEDSFVFVGSPRLTITGSATIMASASVENAAPRVNVQSLLLAGTTS